ncbi:polyprenyl synthetase family protein [Streptomyces sp. NPDC020983]|uniref:polyprenyl synthetase family protein n=1 Tax=Streptomyces sp. NPDC020983 TaxID=3365106 RepID=UPI0037B0F8B2
MCRDVAADTLDLADIRGRIDATLADFLRGRPASLPARHRCGDELATVLADFVLAPGKRVRPLLCVLGWHAAGAPGGERSVLRTAASLELFHSFALIHDDVMDASDTRRGRPSVHRAFAARHAAREDAETFGVNAAIVLGDLALVLSDELLHSARLSPEQHAAAAPLLDAMRREVCLGQYLDLLAAGGAGDDLETALAVVRLKTATYTVEKPLQLGAALGGAGPALLQALSAYALPLGDAFQLRDDLLGTFGDPEVTGKSVVEDLRAGKATVLMALAVRRAGPEQRKVLDDLVGRPTLDEDGAARVLRVLRSTGAVAAVEAMIAERHGAALAALDRTPLPAGVRAALRRIAAGTVRRAA